MMESASLPGREFGHRRIYAFRFLDGRLKIGITNNVRGRSQTLQYEHKRNGVCADIASTWFSEPHHNAHENEAAVHLALASTRLSGEYFSASDEQLAAALEPLSFSQEPSLEQRATSSRFAAALDKYKHIPSAFREDHDNLPLNERLVAEAKIIFGDLAAEQLQAKLAAA